MSKIPEVLEAVRQLRGVAAANVRWPDPLGPATLRVEFVAGADEVEVAKAVLDVVRYVGEAEPEEETPEVEVALPDGRPDETRSRRGSRPAFVGLRIDRDGLDASVAVSLEHAGRRRTGHARGMATQQAMTQSVALATLSAVRKHLSADVRVQLASLDHVPAATPPRGEVVQVAVTWLTHQGEETHVGSALVRGDAREAAVRATLDAVNRRLMQTLAGQRSRQEA